MLCVNMQVFRGSACSSGCHPIFTSFRAAYIHATAPSLSNKRVNWEFVYKRYGKQHLKDDAKRTPLQNVSFFSEYLSQGESESWSLGRKQNWQFLSDKQGFSNRRGRRKSGTSHRSQVPDWAKSSRKNKRGIWSNPDDADDEVMFESSFGRDRYCFWSFSDQGDVQWRNLSWQFSNKEKRNSRTMHEDSYDTEYKAATIGSASDRTILGLAAVGPLKLDDVKNAFRMCALKWHPDRHQGPSKVMAEEKFKHCCAAYKSLCDAFTTT